MDQAHRRWSDILRGNIGMVFGDLLSLGIAGHHKIITKQLFARLEFSIGDFDLSSFFQRFGERSSDFSFSFTTQKIGELGTNETTENVVRFPRRKFGNPTLPIRN